MEFGKLIYFLLVQYLSIIRAEENSTDGRNLFHSSVLGVTKQQNNVFTFLSVNNNMKNDSKLADTVKTIKNYTDPSNGWKFWMQEEYGYYNEDFPIVEGNELPIISPISEDSETKPSAAVTGGGIPIKNSQLRECETSITQTSCEVACKGDLIFEDNFDTMNWKKWNREIRIAMDSGDAEFVSYQNRGENCYVNAGQLHISPSMLIDVPQFNDGSIRHGTLNLEDCTGSVPSQCHKKAMGSQILPPIVSARINTKGIFKFRFGTVEVRAKLPKGDWIFPLILLEPAENFYGISEYASGQMRVAFARGNEVLLDDKGKDVSGYCVHGGAVLASGQAFREIRLPGSRRNHHVADDFHNYTLKWTDEHIVLGIDGDEYARFVGGFDALASTHQLRHAGQWKNGEHMAPFDREFYITLGVAVGGHSDFPDSLIGGYKPWKNGDPKAAAKFWRARKQWERTWISKNIDLHVDYVRVYAL